MPLLNEARRAVLLTLTLLSACAAADPGTLTVRTRESTPAGDFLAGRFLADEGDYGQAAGALLGALAADPNDSDLLLQTFLACVNAGRPEAAALAARLPSNEIAQIVLANASAKAGDWQTAVERFRAVPREGVMQLLQPLLVAWASQGAGETDQALATLRPFLDSSRFRSVFALHAGMIADLAGRQPQAAEFYRIALAEPTNQSPRTALIFASWAARTGHPVEAQGLLAQAAGDPEMEIALPEMIANLTRRPVAHALDGMSEAYATFAAALQGQQTGEFALIMSRLALDVEPTSATALLLAADIQANAKHLDGALALLDIAAKTKDPIVPVVRLHRAALLERMNRTDEAIREVEQLGRDYPGSALPDIDLGDLLRTRHRFGDAVAAYDRAIARIKKPTQADWLLYYSRGVAYASRALAAPQGERAGEWARAEADFNQALTLSPDQPSVLNYLGYSWADMGRNLDRARDMIQRAAARRPNDGAITDSLGWVLFRQGKLADATKMLERAVGLEPEDPTITEHLGDVYWAAGRHIEAWFEWRRAMTLNPTPEDAAKIEAKIKAHPFGAMASGK